MREKINIFSPYIFYYYIIIIIFPLYHSLFSRHRWKKPKREALATQQYFEDYRQEQLRGDDFVRVFRGVGEDGVPEMKISLRGSIIQKLSLGSQNRITAGGEQKSLLEDDGEGQLPGSDDHDPLEMV